MGNKDSAFVSKVCVLRGERVSGRGAASPVSHTAIACPRLPGSKATLCSAGWRYPKRAFLPRTHSLSPLSCLYLSPHPHPCPLAPPQPEQEEKRPRGESHIHTPSESSETSRCAAVTWLPAPSPCSPLTPRTPSQHPGSKGSPASSF